MLTLCSWCREHLARKLAVMERQLLGGTTAGPTAAPDTQAEARLAKQQRLLQHHAEMVRLYA